MNLHTPVGARALRVATFQGALAEAMREFNLLVSQPQNVSGGWQMQLEYKGVNVAVVDKLVSCARNIGWRVELHGDTLCIREPEVKS